MSATPPARSSRGWSIAAAGGLALVAILHFVFGRLSLASSERFVSATGMDLRRPVETWAMRREPTSDLAAALAAEMVLQDIDQSISLADVSAPLRRAWVESVAHRGETLESARTLLLDALARRPGWPYLVYLLARIEAASPASAAATSHAWTLARAATRSMPGFDPAWGLMAAWALESWNAVPAAQRAEATQSVRRALENPDFVRYGYDRAQRVLGVEAARGLLPDRVAPLGVAVEFAQARGDAAEAAALYPRYLAAERAGRSEDLSRIELLRRHGDAVGVSMACRHWAETYGWAGLDDGEGSAQAARVLALWPEESGNPWLRDPRAGLVRFFLAGRRDAAPAKSLAAALDSLTGVPDPVRAEVYLLAGDRVAMESVLRSSPSTEGPEWSGLYARLAESEASAGRLDAARAALGRIGPVARDECEALLAAREIARRGGDRLAMEAAELRVEAFERDVIPPEAWTPQGTLTVCVDKDVAARRVLRVEVSVRTPALIEFGADGGRRGTALRDGPGVVELPLAGLSGRSVLFLRDIAGGPSKVERAAIVAAP